jgi:hypothetical protein
MATNGDPLRQVSSCAENELVAGAATLITALYHSDAEFQYDRASTVAQTSTSIWVA